jgi:hypothetical protein
MKDRGGKKFVPIPFFGAINFTKLNYFIFEMLKKKIWVNFQRIIELFTQKIVTKHSKIWVWDQGSGIRDPGSGKTPSGSRIQGSKRHRIIRNIARYGLLLFCFLTKGCQQHHDSRNAINSMHANTVGTPTKVESTGTEGMSKKAGPNNSRNANN